MKRGNRITRQTQCVAVGDDLDYEKLEINPVVTTKMIPEGSSLEDFRDPKLFIKGEELYFVIGSRADDGSGQVLLYKSKDAINK
ncbi:MAG TPA: glycoside hydrolase family 32 protein [Epulopiscium sp.]|nr:glycoside hydrolase family 32 protein [Candidatus Epulonipiscium sp.]